VFSGFVPREFETVSFPGSKHSCLKTMGFPLCAFLVDVPWG